MELHVLQEFAVPGCVCLVAVTPVDDELRQQFAGKVLINMRQAQNIKNIVVRLPVLGNAPWLRTVAHAGGVLGPLDADVLDEFRVQFPGRVAALAPVEYELRGRLVDEFGVDAAAQHDIQGVPAGSPVVVQGWVLLGPKSLCAALLFSSPAADDVLAKLVLPGVAGFAAFAPVKDEIFQLV